MKIADILIISFVFGKDQLIQMTILIRSLSDAKLRFNNNHIRNKFLLSSGALIFRCLPECGKIDDLAFSAGNYSIETAKFERPELTFGSRITSFAPANRRTKSELRQLNFEPFRAAVNAGAQHARTNNTHYSDKCGRRTYRKGDCDWQAPIADFCFARSRKIYISAKRLRMSTSEPFRSVDSALRVHSASRSGKSHEIDRIFTKTLIWLIAVALFRLVDQRLA